MTVYLLHFTRRYEHAGHYLGSTSNLTQRLATHRAGAGARLIEVITAAGIGFTLARTWPGGRRRERQLKRQGGASRLCPICRSRRPVEVRDVTSEERNGKGHHTMERATLLAILDTLADAGRLDLADSLLDALDVAGVLPPLPPDDAGAQVTVPVLVLAA